MSGGLKYDSEKNRLDLLSPRWIDGVGAVLTFGAKKYAAHNWRKGLERSRLLGAALRHIFAYLKGEDYDPETGLLHLHHASCCLMFASELHYTKPETDDRYKGETCEGESKTISENYQPPLHTNFRTEKTDLIGLLKEATTGEPHRIFATTASTSKEPEPPTESAPTAPLPPHCEDCGRKDLGYIGKLSTGKIFALCVRCFRERSHCGNCGDYILGGVTRCLGPDGISRCASCHKTAHGGL